MQIVSDLEHLTVKTIKNVCNTNSLIERWAYAIHDKDIYTIDDEAKNPEHKAGDLKPAHVHLLLFFAKSPTNGKVKECQFDQVTKWFGLQSNFATSIRSEIGSLRYLTHADYPEKYQYQISDVVSNFDYAAAIAKVATHETKALRKAEIINKISSGEYPMHKITECVTAEEYCTLKRDIDNAMEYRTKAMLADRHRNMQVIFIYGTPGSGKTEYAKKLAETKGKSYYISEPGNDFVDGYTDEECFIWDDPRPGCVKPETFLKFLDPQTATKTSSRFHNKLIVSDLVIITVPYEPLEFFKNFLADGNLKEPLNQFARRCKFAYEFTNDSITYKKYDPCSESYKAITTVPNTHISAKPFMPEKTDVEFLDEYLLQTRCCLKSLSGSFQLYERNESGKLEYRQDLSEQEVCEQFPYVANAYHLTPKTTATVFPAKTKKSGDDGEIDYLEMFG